MSLYTVSLYTHVSCYNKKCIYDYGGILSDNYKQNVDYRLIWW